MACIKQVTDADCFMTWGYVAGGQVIWFTYLDYGLGPNITRKVIPISDELLDQMLRCLIEEYEI